VNGTTTTYTYDANDRLLNEKVGGVVTVAYTYDDNGSTLTKTENGGVTTYVWNDEKRLIQATVGGTVVDYRYNDAGIRVSSKQNGVETRYLLDEGMTANVWEEYGPDGAVQGSYSYGYDLITQTQAGQTSYYLVDGLGSTRLLMDGQGLVLNSYGYEAFGETVSQSGTTGNKYQYAGEQLDATLGDYYLRQRFYDTSSGRFGRMDIYGGKISEPSTLNKYVYAGANPVMGIDPTGLFTSLAEIQTAMNVRNTLAGIQSSGYSYIVSAAIKKGNYSGSDALKEFGWQALFSFASIALPFLFRALLQRAESAVAFGKSILMSSSAQARIANRIPSINGFHDVLVHGTPHGFQYNNSGKWVDINANTLANFVGKGNYQGGNIRLISCNTGGEGATAAQNLANRMGVDVLAPTDKVWVYSNGSMTIGPKPNVNTGTWKIFTPQG
jgi:RHS repeat-associated protein